MGEARRATKTAQRAAASRRGPAGGGASACRGLAGREIFDLRAAASRSSARATASRSSTMASSCSEQRQNLLACLADSPCVAAGRTLKECMEVEDGGCKGLRVAYFTCKRGQLDMRKRIKGNLPQHVDDTEEDNFGGRLLEIQRRKREEDEARKAHAARS